MDIGSIGGYDYNTSPPPPFIVQSVHGSTVVPNESANDPRTKPAANQWERRLPNENTDSVNKGQGH